VTGEAHRGTGGERLIGETRSSQGCTNAHTLHIMLSRTAMAVPRRILEFSEFAYLRVEPSSFRRSRTRLFSSKLKMGNF
jgi:hypothetical protein